VAGELSIDLDDDRRRSFRRFLVVSALLHVVLVALLAWSPGLPVMSAPIGAISVNLVASPGRPTPAPRPKPKAAPPPAPAPVPEAAKPKPKPPVPEKRVLPKESTAPKPAPRAERKEITPEEVARPEPKQQEYADVLDQLRAEAGEEAAPEAEPEAVPEPAAAVAPAGGGGTGRPVSPEVADWMRRARIHVRRSWVLPPGFRQQSLATVVDIELDAGGNVLGEPEIVKRSGNPWYDDGVLRSIRKATPLPAPPDAGVWNFVFVSDESY
jgi:outer membrane biosynthesis protein TonB